MAGLAAGVAGAADPAPKANTLLLLPDAPNPPVLPNWNPPLKITIGVNCYIDAYK